MFLDAVAPRLDVTLMMPPTADFDEVATAITNDNSCLVGISSRVIAQVAVLQSLCDDAARAALRFRHRALSTCLR